MDFDDIDWCTMSLIHWHTNHLWNIILTILNCVFCCHWYFLRTRTEIIVLCAIQIVCHSKRPDKPIWEFFSCCCPFFSLKKKTNWHYVQCSWNNTYFSFECALQLQPESAKIYTILCLRCWTKKKSIQYHIF